jgi:hypothetical protein
MGAGRTSVPEEVEQTQQNQSNQYLVSESNNLGSVNAPGVPASLWEKQVSWRVQEFQGDEPVLLIRLIKHYLTSRTLELPIRPFLSSEQKRCHNLTLGTIQ